MTEPIPPNATSIFLFSPRDQIARDQGGLPRQSYATTDGAKTGYTKEIAADPDAATKIADYEKLNPTPGSWATARRTRRRATRHRRGSRFR